MVAFEILVSGKRLYTIGSGDFGMLDADVHWHRIKRVFGPLQERAILMGRAMHGNDSTHWPEVELKVGDEIIVRIIETDHYDQAAP